MFLTCITYLKKTGERGILTALPQMKLLLFQ